MTKLLIRAGSHSHPSKEGRHKESKSPFLSPVQTYPASLMLKLVPQGEPILFFFNIYFY